MSSPSTASLESAPSAVKRPILKVSGLRKVHQTASHDLTVLKDVNLSLDAGDTLAIIGPSGSGKTTLLGLCAGLDDASAGSVELDGMAIESLDQDARAALRNRLVGFVFQSFQLIPTLTAIENIELPMRLAGTTPDREWIETVVATVGLGDRLEHRPNELSGGQQQRVAVSRALASRPGIIFADEPTGNLDSTTSHDILSFMRQAVHELGQTIVMVTHDPTAASFANRAVFLADGRIVGEQRDPSVDSVHDAMRQIAR
jgi:putative ABC transport system ATP-binding protein